MQYSSKSERQGKDLMEVQNQKTFFDRRRRMLLEQGRRAKSDTDLGVESRNEWPLVFATFDTSTTFVQQDQDTNEDEDETMFSLFQWSTSVVEPSSRSCNLDHKGSNHSRKSTSSSDGCTGGKRAPSNLKSSKSIMHHAAAKKKTLRKRSSSKELDRFVG
mmetsp:Transcript_10175/g.14277  ORF Transcript_10175/g.14277 Transcript_10175/m.14277 type:complete len:160 (-) Transcript_10175:83-562(-)